MRSNQAWLEQAAAGALSESENWPEVLQDIIRRIDTIVENEFLRPTIPPSERPLPSPPHIKNSQTSSQGSQSADKENAPPQDPTELPTASNAPSQQSTDLPLPLHNLHQAIRKTLQTNFRAHPPHTIQRLAELILHPKENYTYLPQYLRAIDRVVQVQSNTTAYPLPFQPTVYVANLPNGTGSTPGAHSVSAAQPTPSPALGSDESLGGALLTPIPWLTRSPRAPDSEPGRRESQGSQLGGSEVESTETNGDADLSLQSESTEIVEGPHGAGRIETVSVVNGVVMTPSAAGTPAGLSRADSAEAAALSDDGEAGSQFGPVLAESAGEGKMDQVVDEGTVPHARGPEEIGVADTGPQDVPLGSTQVINMDVAAGKAKREKSAEAEATNRSTANAGSRAEVGMPDADSMDATSEQLSSDQGKKGEEATEEQDTVMADAEEGAGAGSKS